MDKTLRLSRFLFKIDIFRNVYSFFQSKLNVEMEEHGDILQLSINDGYENLSYKTLSSYAWIWLNFKNIQTLEWIIKLDDDLGIHVKYVPTIE